MSLFAQAPHAHPLPTGGRGGAFASPPAQQQPGFGASLPPCGGGMGWGGTAPDMGTAA